jgi:uncharacterized membrane protein YraQ (UPF0718 family)
MGAWQFFQDEFLGMKWLNRLIGNVLSLLGLDIDGRLGGSVQFFLYDVIKITVLLCLLIFVISYIQSYFPPERSKKILGRFHGIGAVIHNWIPESWIAAVLGSNNPFGVLLATLVGVPMYADIFGTIPVAEALLAKGAQLGTILAFMMAVTTLSLPSIIMLRKAVKPKLLALFVGVCTAGIILVGYLFNVFQFIII